MPHHREHVTIYIKEHREGFRTAFPDPPEVLRLPDLRITVDTPADLAFVESLIGSIPEGVSPIPLVEYLESSPRLISDRSPWQSIPGTRKDFEKWGVPQN